ncbi:hypothetical protein N7465_003975 [Penicillium sp. CMV-2018d]|nr:hypothetical protein N7465_003975 [Penicillium sp. CMV-2018d]
MRTKSQAKRHVLNSLYLILKDYQSIFLTIEELNLLGVKASQVDVSDERLQFDPCFFEPYPEKKILHKYRMVTPRTIEKLDDPPTLDDFLEEAKKSSADEKEQLAIAKSRHKAYYAESTRDGCYDNALEVHRHLDLHLDPMRTTNADANYTEDRFYLFQLTDLEIFDETKGWKKGDPMTCQVYPPGFHWQVPCAYRPRDNGNRAKPHFIIEVVSDAYASAEDQSLTLNELRAIVNLMLPRVVRGRYCKADIHPLLLISYTGFKHGRIIQASYDGKQLTLQFSQLWSFERQETAPVELFCRYLLCETVGLETSTLCVR